MVRGWRGDTEWSMNIVRMRGYFRSLHLQNRFCQPGAWVGHPTDLPVWLGFTAPAFALVGSARLAPEFAPYVVDGLGQRSGGDDASYCSASVSLRTLS